MRIVLVEPYGRAGGHQSTTTFLVTRSLLEIGLDVTIVSRDGFPDEWDRKLAVAHVPVALLRGNKEKLARIPSKQARRHYELYLVHEYGMSLGAEDPDTLIHFWDFDPLYLFAARSKHGCFPFIINLGTADYTLDSAQGTFLRRIIVSFKGKLLRSITAHAVSVCHAKRVLELAYARNLMSRNSSTYVIPSGVDVEQRTRVNKEEARRHLGLSKTEKVILFFGPVRSSKGLDLLIEAFSKLERGRLKLIVAGTLEHSPDYDPLAAAKNKRCSSDIYFITRYIPIEEMDLIFGASDGIVLPYRSFFQGQSDLFLSACQYELPVLASNTGDLGFKMRECQLGILYEPDSVDEIYRALLSFVSMSEKELKKFRYNLTAYANSRPWKQVAKEYAGVYERVHLLRKKVKR